jgi:hypothetical protein
MHTSCDIQVNLWTGTPIDVVEALFETTTKYYNIPVSEAVVVCDTSLEVTV